MSKIALVIGHNARSQGAVRVTDKRTEYDINSDLAVAIRDLDPARYVIVRRTHGTGEIARAYGEVGRLGVAASVELHFNSAEATSATGTETLTSGVSRDFRQRFDPERPAFPVSAWQPSRPTRRGESCGRTGAGRTRCVLGRAVRYEA